MNYIDTHAHIVGDRIDPKEVIENMQTDNLDKIITVGYNKENSLLGLKLARENKNIYCSLGIHPSYSSEASASDLDEFIQLSKDKKVVAIGECGLDYHYENTDKKRQQDFFIRQIELADKVKLPLIIHLRDADSDMQQILEQNKSKLNGGVMHCYSGSKESAKFYLSLGFYISFSGAVTFSNNKKALEIIKAIPLDKILIETDCPYLAPEPFRGKTNYPKYITYTAKRIAEVLDIDIAEVARVTTENARNAFSKLRLD